jgi:hypothetical protein
VEDPCEEGNSVAVYESGRLGEDKLDSGRSEKIIRVVKDVVTDGGSGR